MIGNAVRKTTERISGFLRLESAAGLLLATADVLALISSNTPLRVDYDELLKILVEVRFESFNLAKLLLRWINDGLMDIVFLLIGLDVKREVAESELSAPAQFVFPVVCGNGGMRVPALLFFITNRDSGGSDGRAIPTATDIAFAFGILSLPGNRVPLPVEP